MLEASRDLEYLESIRGQLATEAGEQWRAHSIEGTARVAQSLIDGGYCTLATWNPDKEGEQVPMHLEPDALVQLIGAIARGERDHWGYFLASTSKGDQWAKRYEALVDEL